MIGTSPGHIRTSHPMLGRTKRSPIATPPVFNEERKHGCQDLQRRRQGIPSDLLDARVHPPGYRHPGGVQDHAAAWRGSGRGGGGRGSGVFHRHLDHGVDRPADRPGLLQGSRLPNRGCAGRRHLLLRLRGLSHRLVRGGLGGQRVHLAGGQRVRVQGAARLATGGCALPHRLRQDLRRPAPGHPGRARHHEQVRPPAAGLHHQAQAGSVGQELRSRGVRVPARRSGLHQGRRKHQQPAVHALAPAVRFRAGSHPEGRAGDRRTQGSLPERDGPHARRDVPPRRARQGHRRADHHARLHHRRLLCQHRPGQLVPRERHAAAHPPRHARGDRPQPAPRHPLPRSHQDLAFVGRRPSAHRHRGGQARRRPRLHPRLDRPVARILRS
mmetsp:Transcript_38712/g.90624  ORF Transcript_38712/g.90624 Transcript_38712/m.90624 type:complete len:384 (+) Transcript_38712:1269-2420(+)